MLPFIFPAWVFSSHTSETEDTCNFKKWNRVERDQIHRFTRQGWPGKRGNTDKRNLRRSIRPRGSRGLMDRAVGLVTRGCGFESQLRQELSKTEVRPLSKAPNPQLQCQLPTAPGVCALGWVKCRAQMSLLVILCIIVYVTKKINSSSSI